MIVNENKVNYLYKSKFAKFFINDALTILQDQLIDAFGVSDTYKRKLKIKIDIEILRLRQLIKNDFSTQIDIEILKKELIALENIKLDGDLMDLKISIENYMKLKIDFKEISVFEFYKYVNNVEKWLSQRK
jgi:hypothetical protein